MGRGWGVCLKQIPPHLSAPEISHSSFVHRPGVAPRSRPDPGRMWAPSDCIPDPPHCPPVPPFTALQMAYPSPVPEPWSPLTKPPKPSDSCALHPPVLGCIRGRHTLFTLLHEYWSRSPSLLPASRYFRLLHNSRHPCPFAEYPKDRANWPSICKPPTSPPNRRHYQQSTSTSCEQTLSTPLSPLSVSVLLALHHIFISVSLRLRLLLISFARRLTLRFA